MTTLNQEEWLKIIKGVISNLNGEGKKSAELLEETVKVQHDEKIEIENITEHLQKSKADPEVVQRAIKMAMTFYNKIVATQEMEEILKEEEVLALRRKQEEAEFIEMSVEERAEKFELSNNSALNLELHKLNHAIGATPGRKRPKNPSEWLTLKKWERQRGGQKIGDIGPIPPQLSEQMKELIKARQQDESGFTNVDDIDWDEL